jgi:ATP-binding cassette subfamily B protein
LLRRVWKQFSEFAPHGRSDICRLGIVASVAGMAEAVSLLLAVRVALSLSSVTDPIVFPTTDRELTDGAALAVAAGTCVVALTAHIALARMTATLVASVLAGARSAAVHAYLRAEWSAQALQREGSLQETVTTLAVRTSLLSLSFVTLVSQGLSLAMFMVVALLVDPIATFVVAVGGVVLLIGLRPLALATRRRSSQFVEANSDFAEDVTRMASTSMELRVFGVQDSAEAEIMASNLRVRHLHSRSRTVSIVAAGLYKDLAVLLLIGAIASLLLIEVDSVVGVGVVVTLMVRSLASAQALNGAYQSINEGESSATAIHRRLDALKAAASVSGTTSLSNIDTVEFRSVSYEYSAGVRSLSELDVGISAGEAIGVVGPSGSGKSTFVQVVLRLRPPKSGYVLVNGVDYLTLDADSWASRVAFVPQEPTLLESSISENISYYRGLSQHTIEAAAREANVFDEISRLPAGFETRLGPRGAGLSGGQKQRIAIARALAGQPSLLVLDEPSSALDVHSEVALQTTLRALKGRTTMIIVAHRVRTVGLCDRLLVFGDGRLVQDGTPEQLASSEGFFQSISAS